MNYKRVKAEDLRVGDRILAKDSRTGDILYTETVTSISAKGPAWKDKDGIIRPNGISRYEVRLETPLPENGVDWFDPDRELLVEYD